MMHLTLTIALPCAPPAWFGRVIMPSREVASVAEGRAFARRNADTLRDALAPGESSFVAWIVRGGEPVRTMEFPRAVGSAPIEIGADVLRKMRKTTKTTKTTAQAKGEPTA